MRKILSYLLVVSMLLSFAVPFTALADEATVTPDNCYAQTNFELSEENGANSKLFMKDGDLGDNKGDAYSDFTVMVDYGGYSKRYSAAEATEAGYTSGLGFYPTGADTVITAENFGALVYEIDGESDNAKTQTKINLTTKEDGDTYWNIDGVDYNINPTGKVIKLLNNVHTDLIEDEEVAKKFATLDGVTLDVVDGYYDSMGFLIGINSSDARTFYYKLVYEDETTKNLTSPGIKNPSTDKTTYYPAYGYVYNQKINPTGETGENRSANGHHRYVPVEIDVESDKKLTAIELIANADWSALYIVSAWGNSATPASILSAYTTDTVVNEGNVDAVKADLEKVRSILDANGYNSAELVETKAIYDALYDAVKTYEGNLAMQAEVKKLTENELDFISIEASANSKIFVEKASTLGELADSENDIYKNGTYDYILDFKQSYWWGADALMGLDSSDAESKDASGNSPYYKWSHSAITTFKTDENNLIKLPYLADKDDDSTLNYMTYKVDTSKKVIQLAGLVKSGQKLTTKAAEVYQPKFDSLKSATIDMNGAYKSVYFLGTSSNGQDVTGTLNAKIYYEGEEDPVVVKPSMYKDADLVAIYNKIAGTEKTKIYDFPASVGYMGTAWYSYEIPTDSDKTIEKITFEFTGGNRQLLIAGVTGVKVSISDLIESKKDVEITKENYEENKASLAKINAVIEEKEADIELIPELSEALKAFEAKLKAHEDLLEAEKLYEKESEAVNLNGNARVFVAKGTDLGDLNDPANEIYTSGSYDYVTDFRQELWWNSTPLGVNAEDSSVYTWKHTAIVYEYTDKAMSVNFPVKEDGTFTVPYLNGDKVEYEVYTINPEEKIIQLTAALHPTNQKLTDKAKEAYGAKLDAMKSATVTVEKGNYEAFRFLAYNENGQAITESLFADVYYEGQEAPETVALSIKTTAELLETYNKIEGTSKEKIWEFNSTTGYAGVAWCTYEIPCDATKSVEKITFRLGGSNRQILIAAMNGKKASLADLVTKADEEVNIYNYKKQEARAEAIEKMAEENGLDITKDAELLAELNGLKEKIEAFNAIKETLEPAAVLDVTYKAGKTPVLKLNVINPAVKEGSEFKVILSFFGKNNVASGTYMEDKTTDAKEEYELEVTPAEDVKDATKVKALIWKDLATLKPLAEAVAAER